MPITTDVRKYGETALEQGKLALDEARKPWYAAVGATDLAYDQIREQFKELPTEAQGRLRRLQSGAGRSSWTRGRTTCATPRHRHQPATPSAAPPPRPARSSAPPPPRPARSTRRT